MKQEINEVKTYPNQKIVIVNKATCNNNNKCSINLESLDIALRQLTLNELRLFIVLAMNNMVLAMNKSDYRFAFSPQEIE